MEKGAPSLAQRLSALVERDPARLGGVPVFRGSRVPIKNLFDYLGAGDSLETFLDDFPGISHEQAQEAIELAQLRLLDADPKTSAPNALPAHLTTVKGDGLQPGVDLDNSKALFDRMEHRE